MRGGGWPGYDSIVHQKRVSRQRPRSAMPWWGFGWVDKPQCFRLARQFGAVGSSPDFSRVFHGMALLGLCLETLFRIKINKQKGQTTWEPFVQGTRTTSIIIFIKTNLLHLAGQAAKVVCVCVCHNKKKVPDEWQARLATPAILQVSSSKHNAKKILPPAT